MSPGTGMAIGFAAGLALAGGAILLLRDDAALERQTARIAQLETQVQQLGGHVSKLAEVLSSGPDAAAVAANNPPRAVATPAPVPARDGTQPAAIAEADALVDQGLQSGHWSRQQADELSDVVAHLDVKEQGRIQARISAAINAGELQVDLRR